MILAHSSRKTNVSALITVLGAAAAIAMVAAPGASAGITSAGGLDYVTSKAGTQPTAQTRESADCPKGTRVIGGGASTSGTFGEQQLARYAPSDGDDANFKPDDAWVADADNLGGTARTMKAYAICGPGSYSYPLTQFFAVPGGGGETLSFAPCDDPEHAVSAGVEFASKAYDTLRVTRSESYDDPGDAGIERDDGWVVSFENDKVTPVSVALRVVCAAGDYAYAENPFVAKATSRTAETASCPNKMHVVGGGIYTAGSAADGSLSASRPIDGADADRAPDDGWRVGVDNPGGDSGAIAYATCQV